jgi:NhaP-type Na+/H+ or K+/H+ antiporter
MSSFAIAVVAALVLVWCATSRVLGRADVTAPMVFVAAGVLLGGPGAVDIHLDSASIRLVAEVTLVLVLFSDAARVDLSSLRHDVAGPVRLLGIGLPLTLAAGTAAAIGLFPGLAIGEACLVAACLSPTDASLGAGIVADRRVPSRIRRDLNVESGLNDGIIAPVVTVVVAALAGESAHDAGFVETALRELATGTGIGVAAGVIGGALLVHATRRHWMDPGVEVLAATAVAVGAYAAAVAVQGNGFVAAFAAGLAFGPFRRSLERDALELTESAGQLLATVVWFCFGAAMLRPALGSFSGQALGYALVSLTVVRMIPVALALLGTRFDRATVLFVGWFGPRGLASVIFALIAFDTLGADSGPLIATVSWTVALSVFAHGLSATPLIRRYAAHVEALPADDPLREDVPVPPVRRGLRHHGHDRDGDNR